MASWFGFGKSQDNTNYGFNYGKLYASSIPTYAATSAFSFGSPNYTSSTGVNTGVIQYLYYFIVVFIVILVVLLIVNYTMYPIFRTVPGGKGFIPIPGSDDSNVFWTSSQSIVPVQESTTPILKLVQNWSYMLDIQVDNPTSNTNTPRILLLRGEEQKPFNATYTANSTILDIVPNFNTAIYLDRLTNDLNISVQTTNPSSSSTEKQTLLENIKIMNIPVRKSVRIGVMIASGVFEVYINGYLVRSKTFTSPIREISGNFYPPSDTIQSNTARVKNLRIWNRTLSPAEFRSYGSATDFDLKDMPDSCAA